jgi:hypothetical protein
MFLLSTLLLNTKGFSTFKHAILTIHDSLNSRKGLYILHLSDFTRDEEKRSLCDQYGITLIEVPYWWNGKQDSLLATIYNHRPDVVTDPGNAQPIPPNPVQKRVHANITFPETLMPATSWNL